MSTKIDIHHGIIPLSKFRQSSKTYLKKMQETQEVFVLTQNGQSAAVVLSPETYQKLEYEREFFKAIAEGEKNVAEEKVVSHEKLFDELLS